VRRVALQAILALMVPAALAASAAALTTARHLIPSPTAGPRFQPAFPHEPTGSPGPGSVLVQVLRGSASSPAPRIAPEASQEISVTTIFRERSFTVLADPDMAAGSEEQLKAHLARIFSLRQVDSLSNSLVPLAGGSAVLEVGGHRVQIRIAGQLVGDLASRLEVSEVRDGEEVVASSVIARQGKTIVLVGPAAPGRRGDQEVSFICLTPI
jgi:hypothetical protein